MNPWSTNAVWQNFSSLCQESTLAAEAPNEISRFHHFTGALYFGIAAIEAFLNHQLRRHSGGASEQSKVSSRIRSTGFLTKLKQWPGIICDGTLGVSSQTLDLVNLFYVIRGDLTHAKTDDGDAYRRLETLDPSSVRACVAEYCTRFLEASGQQFPYWFLGWNYLNPRPGAHEIMIINDQQFSFSLQALGFMVPAADATHGEGWRRAYMGSFNGYETLAKALGSLEYCEPKDRRFPLKPILCRRWWDDGHQRTCGNVTAEALAQCSNP